MTLEQLRKSKKTIGIAGGRRKYEAILGALRGRWVNVLITDRGTAERLVVEVDVGRPPGSLDRPGRREDVDRRESPDG